MDAVQRLARLEQRIAELAAGKDIDAAHINVLLSPAQQRAFDQQWRQQQKLRTAKRPAALNSYETLHRQAAALWARCDRAATATAAQRQSLAKLQAKLAPAITAAHRELTKLIAKKPALTQWLDRSVTDTVAAVDTDNDKQTVQQLQATNKALFAEFERLPVLVTSRSEHRRVSVEERFEWKTKRDIRLELLRAALAELNANLVEELEREQQAREVRAAKVFLKAFFDAKDAGKNAWSEANAALQQNGFQRVDRIRSRGTEQRDRAVREMEDALRKRFEAELTDEQREQIELAREFDAQAARPRR